MVRKKSPEKKRWKKWCRGRGGGGGGGGGGVKMSPVNSHCWKCSTSASASAFASSSSSSSSSFSFVFLLFTLIKFIISTFPRFSFSVFCVCVCSFSDFSHSRRIHRHPLFGPWPSPISIINYFVWRVIFLFIHFIHQHYHYFHCGVNSWLIKWRWRVSCWAGCGWIGFFLSTYLTIIKMFSLLSHYFFICLSSFDSFSGLWWERN